MGKFAARPGQFLALGTGGLKRDWEEAVFRYNVAGSAKIEGFVLRIVQVDHVAPAHAGIGVSEQRTGGDRRSRWCAGPVRCENRR